MGISTISISILSEYDYLSTLVDEILGTIKVYKHKESQQQIATSQICFASDQELNKYIQQLKINKINGFANFLPIISFQLQESQMCSIKTIMIVFPYLNTSLSTLIRNKKQLIDQYTNRKIIQECQLIKKNDYLKIDSLTSSYRKYINLYFRQIDVLRIMENLIQTIQFLKTKHKFHQGLSPSCILASDNHKYVIVDRTVFNFPTNYQKAVSQNNVMIKANERNSRCHYLSPQLFEKLTQNQLSQNNYDRQKSDIFTVGLIVLEMCTLKSINPIYNYTNYRIQRNHLNHLLLLVKQSYSQQLCWLLQMMVKITPKERLNLDFIAKTIQEMIIKNVESMRQLYVNKESKQQEPQDDSEMIKKIKQFNNSFSRIISTNSYFNNNICAKQVQNQQKRVIKMLSKMRNEIKQKPEWVIRQQKYGTLKPQFRIQPFQNYKQQNTQRLSRNQL